MNTPEFVYLNKDMLFNQVLCNEFDKQAEDIIYEDYKKKFGNLPADTKVNQLRTASFSILKKSDWQYFLCLLGEVQRRIRTRHKNKEESKKEDFILKFSSDKDLLSFCGVTNKSKFYYKTIKRFMINCARLRNITVSGKTFRSDNVISIKKGSSLLFYFDQEFVFKSLSNFNTIYIKDILKIKTLKELYLWFLVDTFSFKILEQSKPLVRPQRYFVDLLRIYSKELFKQRQTISRLVFSLYNKEILSKAILIKYTSNTVIFYQEDLISQIDNMIPDEIDFSDYE